MNERYLQMVDLSAADPLKMDAFEKIPMIEYYILLNKREEDIKKANKASKKTNRA